MTTQEKRTIRREIINAHMWIARRDYPWQFETYNLRLCVRLYEQQFYGQELKIYNG